MSSVGFEGVSKNGFCRRGQGGFPLHEVRAVDELHIDTEVWQHILDNVMAGSEQGADATTRSPAFNCDKRDANVAHHAARRSDAVLGALQQGKTFFEHGDRRVRVAQIDVSCAFTFEGGFGAFGTVIDVPERHEDAFTGFVNSERCVPPRTRRVAARHSCMLG